MSKYIIRVRSEDDSWLWSSGDWKDYVCQDFDANIVLVENRYHSGTEEAVWWQDAGYVLDAIDNSVDVDEAVETLDDVNPDKVRDAWHYCTTSKDSETITLLKIAEILYPWLHLECTSLSSGRSDYQYAVYVADIVDKNLLEDWWTGDVYDVRVYEVSDDDIADIENGEVEYDDICDMNTETDGMYFTGTEIWNTKRNPQGFKAGMAEAFGIPADDIYDIYED